MKPACHMYTTVRKRKAVQSDGEKRSDRWVDDPCESYYCTHGRGPVPSDSAGWRGVMWIRLKKPALSVIAVLMPVLAPSHTGRLEPISARECCTTCSANDDFPLPRRTTTGPRRRAACNGKRVPSTCIFVSCIHPSIHSFLQMGLRRHG